ncbi:HD family hydrolase [Azoarcus sp. KH32C]|uniref:HD domain-containing protein n=1 Tax=Azoarcus sp. KH32C TaxID=748247 RepID=UPI0002386E8E|nr:HD domain-containing protein [Azoarcus sp. KH32C]BAL23903.1 metal dependent phosphohydrolase, putative [Azoarcus sp. KH32C]
MNLPDLERQLAFLKEIDRLKSIVRLTPLIDRSRRENSAEHSWHLAMYALVLAEHAAGTVDVLRVVKMLLIHDIVEIDAGDVPFHVPATHAGQAERERLAAERLFGLLPGAQAAEFRELWFEFEAAESDDAKFAKALDRFQPMLHNAATEGGTWVECEVTLDQVKSRCRPPIERGSPALWAVAEQLAADHFREDSREG